MSEYDDEGGRASPHAQRERARRSRWADGGLASTVVGWDTGRQIATDEDPPTGPGRWTTFGIALGCAFALVLATAMVATVLGLTPEPESGSGDADVDAALEADAPELRLAIADGAPPSSEVLRTYTDALDGVEGHCEQPRDDLAEVVRSVSETADRFDADLTGLELLRQIPAEAAANPGSDCGDLAAAILEERFG